MSGAIRILHMHPDLEIGGGQQLNLRLILAMNSKGNQGCLASAEHIVCGTMAGGPFEDKFRAARIETAVLNAKGLSGVVRGTVRLSRFCSQRGIDLIHTNNTRSDLLCGQLAAMMCGLPVLNTLHSEPRGVLADPSQGRQKFLPHLKQVFRNRLMTHTTRQFIAVSERMRIAWTPYLRSLGQGDDQITVITPGLDASEFRSEPKQVRAVRAEIVGDNTWPVLMNVTRLVNGKGLEHLPALIKAVVARYPGAKLVVVGRQAALVDRSGHAGARTCRLRNRLGPA